MLLKRLLKVHFITDPGSWNTWHLNLVFFTPQRIFEISSVLHVALLVFLRLMAVRNPLSDEKGLILYRRISITVVWITSIVFSMMPVILDWLKIENGALYVYQINLYLFRIFPVFAIVIMWSLLIWTAKRKQSHGEGTLRTQHSMKEPDSRRMAEIIRRLVIILLVCYIPNLVWRQYFWTVLNERSSPMAREVKIVSISI